MDWWWLFVLLNSKPDSVDQDPTLLKSVCRASSSSLDLIVQFGIVCERCGFAIVMGSSLHEFISNQHGFKSLRRLNFFSRPYFHYSLSSFPYFRRSLSYFFVKVSSSTQAKSPSFIHMSRFASQSLKNICISFNKMIVCLLESNKKPQSVFFLPQSNKFSTHFMFCVFDR